MEYEPLKKRLNSLLRKFPGLRKLFYFGLDALLLRQWYVKRGIKQSLSGKKVFRFYDAGAGFGQYSFFILQQYPETEVLAVDLDGEKLSAFAGYCKKYMKAEVRAETADLQEYIPAEEQDLIIAVDILEHIEDDLTVLKNFYQGSKPGARLIISTPYATKEASFAAEHFRNGYTENDLSEKLGQAGWIIEKLWYSYGFWGNIAWYLTMRIPLSLLRFKLLLILLPLYYALVYPFAFLMMTADFLGKNRKGKGMVVTAKKR
jgi:SAM-dependent methyltransferase